MCAWRVLVMLRRVACVGACHNFSLHHTARFCCAAALGARVHRCGNIGTVLCKSNNLDTNPSIYIHVHRGSSITSIFSVFLRRSQMADSRQRAESKTLQVGPCARAVVVVVVAVFNITRIIESAVTGQAPVTLELRNTPERKKYPLFTASSCFVIACHVLSSCTLVLNNTCSLHNILQ